MGEHREEVVLTTLQAVCQVVAKRMRAEGFSDFYVLSEPRRVRGRLHLTLPTLEAESEAAVRHVLFITGEEQDILVRIGDHLPRWTEACPTVHVSNKQVWLTGAPHGAFLAALAQSVETAIGARAVTQSAAVSTSSAVPTIPPRLPDLQWQS